MPKRLLLGGLVALAALVLTGCSGGASGTSTGDGRISVVTSTNVYGQIAQQIGGDAVTVTALIDSPSQDPHEYEATASNQLAVRSADLLVENGGGYDTFFDSLVQASGSSAPVVVAAEHSPAWKGADHLEGFNEHVWYDPATTAQVADAIATQLSTLDPSRADAFAANAQAFTTQVAGLESALAAIATQHRGAQVFVTEPVPGYLIAAAALDSVTPDAFSQAVEEGHDVPPATLLDAIGLLRAGTVKLVIVNAQAGGAETTQVVDTATAAGIPVLEFTETLPAGQTYVQWMQQNIDQIAQALGK
ncbi:zinc ABC transporter substrate-binding protein [Microbacterium sp. X-17]|uniref:metal ABC transporter solute-binding protein, Zn/Mn family n=1 Tax=Microbacterium sp. X-17 TaxID=3144404 RepID=UPI0031F59829